MDYTSLKSDKIGKTRFEKWFVRNRKLEHQNKVFSGFNNKAIIDE